MQLDLAGKVALVTGASRGIGHAIAEALAAEGCRIAMNARDDIALQRSASMLKGARPIAGDVTNPDDAKRIVSDTVAAFGGLDILVCNVGSGRSVPPGEESPEEWQRVFAVNLWSTTNMVAAAREALAAAHGSIICISSICGMEVIPDAPVTYSSAKAALHAYVRGMARPLGKQGVRINAVAPGNVLFEGSVWARKLAEDADSVESMLKHDVALGKLGSPQDIAQLVAYLASPRTKFATGGVWTLDGGQVRS